MSPILKVIAGLQLGPWNFWKLRLGPFSPPSSLPACSVFQRRPPPLCSAAARRGGPASRLLLRAGAHASLRSFSTARCCTLVPPCRATRPAEPRTVRAAATSPSRWRARCRGRRPLLASARALQIPLKLIPLALLLSPRSHATERRRRHPQNPGELTPTAEPPFQSSSTPTAPTNSFASS